MVINKFHRFDVDGFMCLAHKLPQEKIKAD